MKNIYGTIGYTLLKNPNTENKIIVLADMHDRLQECANNTNISDWFKSKFHSSKILLEEVPREKVTLQELWTESPHTQNLKKLFLKNQQIIHAVDIRPFLIPFSWELLSDSKTFNDQYYDIKLKKYLFNVNNFFKLELDYLIEKLPNYKLEKIINTKLGKHFLEIKKNWKKFLINSQSYLNSKIIIVYKNNSNILEKISDILNEIMEWYICANIELNSNKSIILHTGLAHSDKVIEWLINHYNFIQEDSYGINKMDEIIFKPMSGCIQLPDNIETQFGGMNEIGFYN
jgi:hypothetical protein